MTIASTGPEKKHSVQGRTTPFLKRPLSLDVRFFIAAAVALLYLIGVNFPGVILSEKWLIDASKIEELAERGIAADNSFGVTAALFAIIPRSLLNLILYAFAVSFSVVWALRLRVFWHFVLFAFVVVPVLFLCLVAPTKDFIVVVVSSLIAFLCRKSKPKTFIIIASLIYFAYASEVRVYYYLIPVVWVGLIYFVSLRKLSTKIILALLAIGALWLVPFEILQGLQSPRDMAHAYGNLIGSNNRSSFSNPFPPGTPINFLGNYAYAFLQFNLPLLFARTPAEIFMNLCQVVIWSSIFVSFRAINSGALRPVAAAKAKLLILLFLSHVLVLYLFNPDLGTHLRHLSSASVYLFSALWFLEWKANADTNLRNSRRSL